MNSTGLCPYCGNPLPDGAAICPSCTARLNP
ncbi:zinc-ribbon domain-containing protein [Crossiella sp. SN42]|nr:zinc-ribbon domain-containing protein [Crossiella sp. SN42]MCO1577662.1 zinc-ribbon domain-containing protein [Crossiella sp. SN42]